MCVCARSFSLLSMANKTVLLRQQIKYSVPIESLQNQIYTTLHTHRHTRIHSNAYKQIQQTLGSNYNRLHYIIISFGSRCVAVANSLATIIVVAVVTAVRKKILLIPCKLVWFARYGPNALFIRSIFLFEFMYYFSFGRSI